MLVFPLTNLLTTNHTVAMHSDKIDEQSKMVVQNSFQGNYEDLKYIGKKYLSFMKKIVSRDTPATPNEISELFANKCEKIENGTILFNESIKLSDQLTDAHMLLAASYK